MQEVVSDAYERIVKLQRCASHRGDIGYFLIQYEKKKVKSNHLY